MIKYAGIGSRDTPFLMLEKLSFVAGKLDNKGFLLRSGGAKGADRAFELASTCKEIISPNDPIPEEAFEMAKRYHTHWHNLDDFGRRAHARNMMVIMGQYLDDPVAFVVCWTEQGAPVGGTATGIRCAESNEIPVFNFGTPNENTMADLKNYVRAL